MSPLFGVLLLVGGVFAWAPNWTRPDLYFSVTVPVDFAYTAEARRILRRYQSEIALHTLIAAALAFVAREKMGLAVLLAIGWELIGTTWAVARARNITLQFRTAPNPVRTAVLTPRAESFPSGWIVASGPLAFLGFAALYARLAWQRLPQQIAVHWGLNGADRWVERTPQHVFGFLLILASVCGVMLLSAYGVMEWSRRIATTGDAARSESLFRRTVVILLTALPYFIAIPPVLLAFGSSGRVEWLTPLLLVAVVGAIVTLIRMGQGGSRLTPVDGSEAVSGDRTPDVAWKLGQFYYNPDDPAIFVERRFGIGYTLNFGNRKSWLIMLAMLAPVFLIAMLR
jgi:uncharacterized membrane protein